MKVWLPSHTLTNFARTNSVQSALFGLSTLALITSLTSNCFGQFTAGDFAAPDEDHSILVREGEQLGPVEPHQSGAVPKPYTSRLQIADKSAAQAMGTRTVASEPVGGGFLPTNSQPDRADRPDSRARSLSSSSLNGSLNDSPRGDTTGNLRPAKFSAVQASGFSSRPAPAPRSHESFTPLRSKRRASAPQQASRDRDVIVDRSVAPASYSAPVQSFQNQQRTSSSPRQSLQSLQPRQNTGQANRYDSSRNRTAQNGQTAPHRQGNSGPKKTSSSAKVLIARFGFNASQDNSENLIPLRLADVLNQGQMRANRGQLINQYWDTFDAWAQSVSGKQHRDWVNGLRVSKSTDQSTVGVAKSNVENEVTANRIQLGKSQTKLKSILGTRASIVPADLPTVTMVKTNFEAFKARGLIPTRFEGIDQTLNDLHELVLSRADTVLMAERAAEQVKGYYQSNQATIEQLLGAGRAWRSAEAEFVSSTIEYNKAYADYALALPYGQAPVEQVVAMLVVPANALPSDATSSGGRNSQQAQLSRTPSQPASSSRSAPQQRRGGSPQAGQDSRVRAASNGFGRSNASQSRKQRPTPDFSDPSNAAAAAASFASVKTPEFRPNTPAPQRAISVAPQRSNSVAPQGGNGFASQRGNTAAPQRGNSASSRDARPAPFSFGGGSAGQPTPTATRENVNAAGGGFGSRSVSQPTAPQVSRPTAPQFSRPAAQQVSRPAISPVSQPAAQPSALTPNASDFGGGQPKARGFSNVSANSPSASSPSAGNPTGFGSRANNGLKRPSTDPFSSRPSATQPSATQPTAQPPTKPTASFGVGGSGTRNKPASSTANDGFTSGFGR